MNRFASSRFTSRVAVIALASSSLAALVAACSANGTGDGVIVESGGEAGATAIVAGGVVLTAALLTEKSPDRGDGFTPEQARAPLVRW